MCNKKPLKDFRKICLFKEIPRWLGGKEFTCHCRRWRFDPCIGKILWWLKWLPTPVFLPQKSHRQRNLEGYSPWSDQELNMTEWLRMHTVLKFILQQLHWQWTGARCREENDRGTIEGFEIHFHHQCLLFKSAFIGAQLLCNAGLGSAV